MDIDASVVPIKVVTDENGNVKVMPTANQPPPKVPGAPASAKPPASPQAVVIVAASLAFARAGRRGLPTGIRATTQDVFIQVEDIRDAIALLDNPVGHLKQWLADG